MSEAAIAGWERPETTGSGSLGGTSECHTTQRVCAAGVSAQAISNRGVGPVDGGSRSAKIWRGSEITNIYSWRDRVNRSSGGHAQRNKGLSAGMFSETVFGRSTVMIDLIIVAVTVVSFVALIGFTN